MIEPITAGRLVAGFLRRFWPVLVIGPLLLALWIQHQRIAHLNGQLGTASATITAKDGTIHARDAEITILHAAIDEAAKDADRRARQAAQAMREAEARGKAREREIERLRAYKPATGDQCQDTLQLLRDYRSRRS